MLKLDLNRLCRMISVPKLSDFLRSKGYTKAGIARYTRLGIKMMTLQEIEDLCLVFKCTPNDLFTWQPDEKNPPEQNHPLEKLKAKEIPDLLGMIKTLPPDKLAEAEAKLKELINK